MNQETKTAVQWVTIDEGHEHQRIDNFLITHLKGLPKSAVYRILRKGEVRVNKKRIKPEYKLSVGDLVRIPPVTLSSKSDPLPSAKLTNVAQLNDQVLYEDERVIVINKPSGLAVHGGSGLQFGLIEGLRALRPDAHFLELVHRLDRETSGCILIAKKRSALRHLHAQLRNNTMHKHYTTLVCGKWPKHRHKVKVALKKNQLKSGERMVYADPNGKPSETRFKIEQQFEEATLLQAFPITGRTHQIRVHCQYAGHSIAGDPKYTSEQENMFFKEKGLNRLFLHASHLQFIHPGTERKISIDAPLGSDLIRVIKNL